MQTFLRRNHREVLLGKGVLKICSKFTGEHPRWSAFSITTLFKSHFGISVLLQICCIFSEHLLLGTPLGGCFCFLYSLKFMVVHVKTYLEHSPKSTTEFFYKNRECLSAVKMLVWLLSTPLKWNSSVTSYQYHTCPKHKS